MKLTKQLAMLAGAVAVVGSVAFASPAVAAPGYPGTTTTTVAPPVGTPPGVTITLGCGGSETIGVGATDTVELTGCTPGATYTITIDGASTGLTVTDDGSGDATLVISVTDPHISVDGSTPEPAVVGNNAVVLTPTSGTGPTLTDIVVIPAATTTAASGTSSGGSGGTVATSGSLAFTGADIAATVVGGIALLAIGTLLVVFTRRRAGHQRA